MKTVKGKWLHLLQLVVLVMVTTIGSAQLRADFTSTIKSGCPPMVVGFKDSSSGNPVSWKWDLGNGTISYLQNPITTYFKPGTYNVKLLVADANGEDSIARSEYIVVNALPSPSFTVSDSVGCFPLKVRFTDSSAAGSGVISNWQWDFGDGTLSKLQSPIHTYTSPGSFTVILRATNSLGCANTITKPGYIQIKDGVKADFDYQSSQGCRPPTPVTFTNKSSGTSALTYKWDFGNGQVSTQENPVNQYQNAGVFSVKLIASTSFGCTDTMVKANAINIGFVKANFSKPDSVCVNAPFQLINTSIPASFVSSKWDFGNDSISTVVNPTTSYPKPGVYNIKVVTDFGSCQDSVIKQIKVLAAPVVNFASPDTVGCRAPFTANFSNTSQGETSYLWSFGDATTSTLRSPSHKYTANGKFSVTLTVKNANGCAATMVQTDYVKIVPPKIKAINGLQVRGCIPTVVSPVAVLQDSAITYSYSWDFGDGGTSQDAKPSHTYTAPGKYDVKLIVRMPGGCADTMVVKEAVKVGLRPSANFVGDPLDVCANVPVAFTDLSTTAPVDEWFWTFGDGSSSNVQNPMHIYSDTGYFNVTLVAYSVGCADTLKLDKYVHIRPPIAKFDTAFICSDPLTRNFLNKSIGATAWQWEFGDGSSSSDQKPSHTYAAPGTYEVVLKVTNGVCEHTAKKSVVVIQEDGKLIVSDTATCLNTRLVYSVTGVKAANVASYAWYFNGLSQGGIATTNNPVATSFNSPGTRNSAVIVTDILKCRDTLYTVVPVNTYGVKAAFSSDLQKTCFGNTVNFTDATKTDGVHPIVAWTWNYGEGGAQTFSSGPFSHGYTAPGTYDVKMIVKDSYGCKDSVTKAAFINITRPIASFTASDTALCPKSAVTFTNKSTGEQVTYVWTFGDNTSSNDVSPVHTFSDPGEYVVKMVMTDKNGCQASMSDTIHVYTAKADFDLSDSVSTCPPLIVNITNKSSNYIRHNWDFGDGGNSQLIDPSHIYTYPGNYTVKLVVYNTGGCSDSLTKRVVIKGPTGTFDYFPKEICNPGTVNFTVKANNTVNYIYDYSDGNTNISTATTATHKFVSAGFYLPKIILEDAYGCKVAVTGADKIKVDDIETHIKSNNQLLCDKGTVNFSDSTITNDVAAGWLWNFGDGTTSTSRTPTHNFADTGFYTVTLKTTTKFGCSDVDVVKNYIKIVKTPNVQLVGGLSACEPAQLTFSGALLSKDTSALSWKWAFGNGSTSNKQEPPVQKYDNAGNYSVTLVVTNSDGCANTITKTAVIHPKPVVDAGPNSIVCRYNSFTLKASGADTYTWSPAATLSCSTCVSPVAKPDSAVLYHVVGKTIYGCTNEDSVLLKVQQPFKMTVSNGDTLCLGETVTLKATGADLYQWTPSLYLDKNVGGVVTSKPDTTVTYQVTGTDSIGCFRQTGSVKLKVYPRPVIDITNGDNITVQVGNTVKLTTKSSPDVTKWKWIPGEWLSCASCAETVSSPKDNVVYHVVATNEGNCSSDDAITINLICDQANVFMPNTFSPNGDGHNDVFYPRGSGLYNIKSFKIFNRWGQLVYSRAGLSANNPTYGWDGTLNGAPLQPDVYVYLIEVVCANNIVFPFKGNVSLIR